MAHLKLLLSRVLRRAINSVLRFGTFRCHSLRSAPGNRNGLKPLIARRLLADCTVTSDGRG